ncbi:MAG: saccharopine dehydrogenase NADP-binding domain-containing protein [Acidobacteriota bacterium]|nr:saccharopine dehydrogenase NADP-binding domain-containing protein [Acidobacteriota bacterium]
MKILVLGAGKMGRGAVHDLAHNSPDVTEITIADSDFPLANFIAKLEGNGKCVPQEIDVENFAEAVELMRGHDAAISCVPYFYNMLLAEAAVEARVNFCDLGGNNTVVGQELSLDQAARDAGINIIPDCGLAPGMVSVLATHGASRFDAVDSIKIRVGGLPQNPKPPLDYQLVFSVEGLINEYVERAIVIRDGEIMDVESLTETELLEFEGFPPLEAFQTSGGTSTLPQTFLGRVRELDYKTIRYRGHCERFKTLIDLGFADSAPQPVKTAANEVVQIIPRRLLSDWLVRRLPRNEPDLVLIRLEFTGTIEGRGQVLRYDIVDRFDEATELTAMMRTTAFPASIVAQMMARGETLDRGAMPQESVIPPDSFIEELARRNLKIQESRMI